MKEHIKDNSVIKNTHLAHKQHIDELFSEKDARLYYINDKDCLQYALNVRTLDILSPFWSTPNNSWLTIADYNGLEANYFAGKKQNVTASDISDTFLKEAASKGAIASFKAINVENIELEDNSFDYVSCREAYHHFPRAYIGLYEMIRVSRKATIIIEPLDILTKMPELVFIKNFLDRFSPTAINKVWKNRFSFETVGNYVFKISEREVEKMAMGLGLPCIAFKAINRTPEGPIQKSWRKIRIKNLLCKLKLIPYSTLCCVIFKQMPDSSTVNSMKIEGYKIIYLPKNPYLKGFKIS